MELTKPRREWLRGRGVKFKRANDVFKLLIPSTCPNLGAEGECLIYAKRPLICKVVPCPLEYGVLEGYK